MAALKIAVVFLVLAAAMPALRSVDAAEYTVGESAGWIIPSPAVNYSSWALKNNYHPGDALVFVYPQQVDSVLEVNRADFISCVKTNPINHHSDGKTLIRLSRPGPHWFISGVPGHCEQGQKFGIMVTPAAAGSRSSPQAPSPAPSSSTSHSGPFRGHAPRADTTASTASAPAPAPISAAPSSRAGFVAVAAAAGLAIALL